MILIGAASRFDIYRNRVLCSASEIKAVTAVAIIENNVLYSALLQAGSDIDPRQCK